MKRVGRLRVGRPIDSPGTILVAEDREQVGFLVAKVLGRAGYRVLGAASGDEALRLAEAQHTPVDRMA